jgi:hypothetical protein
MRLIPPKLDLEGERGRTRGFSIKMPEKQSLPTLRPPTEAFKSNYV